jgi:hypothetical protein
MRFVAVLIAMVFALGGASVDAQGRGNGQSKKASVSAPKAKSTQSPKGSAKQATKAERRTVKAETRTAKAETRAARKTAKAETRAAKAETKALKTETQTPKVNSAQETRLLAQLPPGSTIEDASRGFKNRGQFIAAVNASTNHNIPFDQLKTAMTGIAPGAIEPTLAPMSLGQAIQSLKGTVATTPATPPTTGTLTTAGTATTTTR